MHLDKKEYYIDGSVDLKIVQISDIHFSIDYNLKRLHKVLDYIDSVKPNYVCIVGDLIDEYDVVNTNYINYLKDWLRMLSYKYKVIISLGNHDFIVKKGRKYVEHDNILWLKELESDRLIVLNNEVYKDNGINFIGYNPDYTYYYIYHEKKSSKYFLELSDLIGNLKGYNILLLHTPSIITNNNISDLNVNLVLCGHTHGGLIPSFVSGNFGIVSPQKTFFPRAIRGMIKFDNFNLIISGGLIKLSRKSKIGCLNDVYGYNINVINIKKIS